MLLAGVSLSVAGFSVPPVGEISDSVLWFFAQCCLYAGSMMGVSIVVASKINSKFGSLRDQVLSIMEQQKKTEAGTADAGSPAEETIIRESHE